MRTTEIEISAESREVTGVSVVTLRSPRMGDCRALPARIIYPSSDSIDSITIGDMLRVIEKCLDGTVDIKVIETMFIQDIQNLYGEALLFSSPNGESKIKRNWTPAGMEEKKADSQKSSTATDTVNSSNASAV